MRVAASIRAAPSRKSRTGNADEGERQEADRGRDRRTAADPIPHGETTEPSLGDRGTVEFGAFPRHRHGGGREIEARRREGGLHLEHAVARFLGPARLRDHDDERGGQPAGKRADRGEKSIETVRVRVVGDEQRDGIGGVAQRRAAEHRTQSGAADADDENARKRGPAA
jgi:hypothetical protein